MKAKKISNLIISLHPAFFATIRTSNKTFKLVHSRLLMPYVFFLISKYATAIRAHDSLFISMLYYLNHYFYSSFPPL